MPTNPFPLFCTCSLWHPRTRHVCDLPVVSLLFHATSLWFQALLVGLCVFTVHTGVALVQKSLFCFHVEKVIESNHSVLSMLNHLRVPLLKTGKFIRALACKFVSMTNISTSTAIWRQWQWRYRCWKHSLLCNIQWTTSNSIYSTTSTQRNQTSTDSLLQLKFLDVLLCFIYIFIAEQHNWKHRIYHTYKIVSSDSLVNQSEHICSNLIDAAGSVGQQSCFVLGFFTTFSIFHLSFIKLLIHSLS